MRLFTNAAYYAIPKVGDIFYTSSPYMNYTRKLDAFMRVRLTPDIYGSLSLGHMPSGCVQSHHYDLSVLASDSYRRRRWIISTSEQRLIPNGDVYRTHSYCLCLERPSVYQPWVLRAFAMDNTSTYPLFINVRCNCGVRGLLQIPRSHDVHVNLHTGCIVTTPADFVAATLPLLTDIFEC